MCNCKKNASTTKKSSPPVSSFRNGVSSSPRNPPPAFPSLANTQQAAAPPLEVDGETIEDKCRTFAYMLGLEEPVSKEVLIGALEVPAYARSLMAAKDKSNRFYDLLNNPPRTTGAGPATPLTNSRLLSKASKALMKWAVSGFPTVSKTTLEKREDACLACPNLVASANKLQQISASSTIGTAIGKRTGNKSCAACGCVITNKIRLATESCPVPSEENAELNRWGEELKNAGAA